jgi:hypothetical protein
MVTQAIRYYGEPSHEVVWSHKTLGIMVHQDMRYYGEARHYVLW